MIQAIAMDQKKPLVKNYHFWAIVLIFAFLIIVYLPWPWREWNLDYGIWRWMGWLAPLYDLAKIEVHYQIVGSLFLLPVIYASIVFKWQGSLIGSVVLMISVLPIIISLWGDFTMRMTNIIVLLLPITIVMIIKIELELRRKDKNIYIAREKEYQAYLTKILETQEQERRRLAEELHDGSVQTLLAVASYAESVELTDDDVVEMKHKAAWIKETIRSTVEDLRKMSIDLRPGVLDDMGLVYALKWLVSRTNKTSGIHVHLTIGNLDSSLNPELEVNIFRIVQEALHNIEKHSKSTEAFINIEAATRSLKLVIRDNGRGFTLPDKLGNLVTEGKLGLIGIHERIRSLGGVLEIDSRLNAGTCLSIDIPFPNYNNVVRQLPI
jgi:two-component system, NarL family, sensor histidine kinase DegS